MSGPLQISRITPSIGWPGTIVTITGTNFSSLLDGNTVDVGSERALVLKASTTELQVVVGDNAADGPVVVKRGAASATFARPFKISAWPDITKTSDIGPPLTLHGPQEGTPKAGVLNQSVVAVFCHGKGTPPRDPTAVSAATMTELADTNRYWTEATYAVQRAADPRGPQGTTWNFVEGPWVELPRVANEYIYQEQDLTSRLAEFIKKTKRWSVISGFRAVCVHAGGGLAVTDLNSPPTQIARLPASWVGYHVVVRENVAFVAAGADGLIAINISGPTPVELSRVHDVGDLVSCDLNDNILVASALDGLTLIFDISDPTSMSPLGNLQGIYATNNSFVKVVGNLVFAAQGQVLVLFDLESPAGPVDQAIVMVDENARITGIDVLGNTCVVATAGAGMVIVEVADRELTMRGSVRDALNVCNVQLAGTKAVAACGPDGILVVDVADLGNPRLVGSVVTSRSCYHVTPPIPGNPQRCFGSFGGLGVAIVGTPLSDTPNVGAVTNVANNPGLGQDPDYATLMADVEQAADRMGTLKNYTGGNLFVDVINNSSGLFDIVNHDGLIVFFSGVEGRGSGSLRDAASSSWGGMVDYGSKKGVMWLPTPTDWKRVAHELGHWFEFTDVYSEIYHNGTVLEGTAAEWDLMGNHRNAPLFAGPQAEKLGVYSLGNIATRHWTPDPLATVDEEFVIVAHGATENDPSTGSIHLLKIDIPETSIRYYVEVRQQRPMDGTNPLMFDRNVPIFTGDPKARVVVTRAEDAATRISNSFERLTSLVDVLDVEQSAYDAARLIRIRVDSVVSTNPAAFRVKLQMKLETPTPGGQFDLHILPMKPGVWESPDIWVNSTRNDQPGRIVYESHEGTDVSKPTMNGDRPWVHHKNTITARVHNQGLIDAENVMVTAYTNVPPGIGDNGDWAPLQTKSIPFIQQGTSEMVDFEWSPRLGEHTCITVAIFPLEGEERFNNNRSQENVFFFDSAGASSHEPVVIAAEVRSPFTVWRCVELRIFGLPDGWHATVDKRWVWVPPRGKVPVTVVVWTDRDSPRLGNEPKKIDAQAFVRVEGWTYYGHHAYRPIGGLLAAVKANARSHIKAAASGQDNRIRTSIQLIPSVGGVPGTVEITSMDLSRKTKLVNFTTGAGGVAEVVEVVRSGEYGVQVFTASTAEVAEAESGKIAVRVGVH